MKRLIAAALVCVPLWACGDNDTATEVPGLESCKNQCGACPTCFSKCVCFGADVNSCRTACGLGGDAGGTGPGGAGGGGGAMAGNGGTNAGGTTSGGNSGNNSGGNNSGGTGSGGTSSAGEPPELSGITDAHNQARATEGVGPLTWDPALAEVAKAWAEACVDQKSPTGLIDHNDGRSDNYPGYVGENIYGASGQASGQQAVSSWMSEEQYYDYATGHCSGVCGHYTQVMWAASKKLGCALANCPGMQFGNAIVCNYSPGGNSGGKPF